MGGHCFHPFASSLVVETSDVKPEEPLSPHHLLIRLLVLHELLHVFQVLSRLAAVVAHAQIYYIAKNDDHDGDSDVEEVVGSDDSNN